MERFRQEFEISADCKKSTTMFRRFEKKYPEAWNVWGEMFKYMLENNIEHMEEKKEWSLWLYINEDTNSHYMAVVLMDKEHKI